MVYAQAALAKQEKISDVMIGHFLATAAMLGNLYSRWTNVITTSRRSMITLNLFVTDFGPWTKDIFRKLAPVVLIWQMFISSLLSIKTQLSTLSHPCHSRGVQHSLACCNLLVICVFLGYKASNFVKKFGCYRCLKDLKI